MKKTKLAMLVMIAITVLPSTMTAEEVSASTSEQRRFKPGEALAALSRIECPIKLTKTGSAVYVREGDSSVEVVIVKRDQNGSWTEHTVHPGFVANSGTLALEKELQRVKAKKGRPSKGDDTLPDTLVGLNRDGISPKKTWSILCECFHSGEN